MTRLLLCVILMATTNLIATPATVLDTAGKKSCSEHPKLVGRCFRVRGRLSLYNGNPSLRIWRIGTKRMLGISELRFADPEVDNVPESIRSMVAMDTDLFGDFLVCPFTRSRPGEMQLVCVQGATNTVTKKQIVLTTSERQGVPLR